MIGQPISAGLAPIRPSRSLAAAPVAVALKAEDLAVVYVSVVIAVAASRSPVLAG